MGIALGYSLMEENIYLRAQELFRIIALGSNSAISLFCYSLNVQTEGV